MFAPTFSLEMDQREKTPPEPKKATRSGTARRARKPVATLITCMLTFGMAMAGHAQNVVITGPPSPINEGAAGATVNANFSVSLDSAPSTAVDVTVQTVDGTAVAGSGGATGDYTATPAGGVVVHFNVGEVGPKTVPIAINGDNLYEPANGGIETFSLTATSATGATVTAASTATARIQDDEAKPVITISDPAPITEGNSGTQAVNFTAELSGPSQDPVSFTYTAAADTSSSGTSATPGVDFQNASNTISFAPGTTTRIFSVNVIGDTKDETTETFVVNLSNAVGADIAVDQATATINDDDGPTIQVFDSGVTEGDNESFLVSLNAPSPETVTVNYATADNTATAGQDYDATSGTLTFLPGQTTQSVTVPTTDDNLVEGVEFFTFNLSGASGGSTFSDNQAIGTINDNESTPIITATAVRQLEGDAGTVSNFVFNVNLSAASTQTISVRYATSPGSPNPATAGTDYKTTSGTLTFTPGVTQRTISVPVIGDSQDETDETFNVTLSQVVNAQFSPNTTTSVTTGTILNDDGPTITFQNTNVSTKEGNAGARTNATFVVQLSAPSFHTVTVGYLTQKGITDPATAGSDYTATTGTLTFKPGVRTQTINVEIKGDVVDEADETYLVTLTRADGGTIPLNQETATGTILDDDATPVVSIGNVTANEGQSGQSPVFTFGLVLDRASTQPITVDYATSGVTATADVDFKSTSGTVTFNPGVTRQTIPVTVIGDNADEPTETFSVALSNPVNATLSSAASVGTGTIRDDDVTPQLSINTNPISIREDTAPTAPATEISLNFVVTMTGPSGKDVTFNYATVDPTVNLQGRRPATGGADYRPANGVGVIPAGQTSTVISVVIFNDARDEYDEYFNVVITDPQNATIKRAVGTGVIIDEDEAPTVKIAAPDADHTAIEGGRNATFPVTLSAASGRDVTVFYSIVGDGATNQANPIADLAPVDQNTGAIIKRQTQGSIVIPAGTTKSSITIAALADKEDEADEGYRINITSTLPAESGPAAVADGTAASTIADRNPGLANFTPHDGNESYNGANNNGTLVTFNGDQFKINNVSQIREVRFGVTTSDLKGSTIATEVSVVSDTVLTARVPNGAKSGKVRIVLNDGTILTPTDNQADQIFYVNAVVTGFTPNRGVPRHTVVTISGRNFKDPLNPVTGVRFSDGTNPTVDSNVKNAGVDPTLFTRNGVVFINATVPDGAKTGPIAIVTKNGTNYPPSVDSFNVDGVTAGGIRFAATPTYNVQENERGDLKNPLAPKPIVSYTLQLRPAVQGDGNNTSIAPRGDVVVAVTIADATPAGNQVRLPKISVPTGRVKQISGQRFEVTFDAGTLQDKTINLIDAGDDDTPPAFVSNAPFQVQNPVALTLSASIIRTGDAEAYPVDQATNPNITINRLDIHGLDTDIGTTLRTTEDQNSPDNITHFKLNLRNVNNGVDVASDKTPVSTVKYTNRPQPTVLNPDGTVNTDAEPTSDVFLPFKVSRPEEGLIRYYVMKPTFNANGKVTGYSKVYPNNDAVFRTDIVIIYATDPTRDEYYKYDHYVEVKGVDDALQDGPQSYQVLLQQAPNGFSTDPEFFKLNLVTPFTLVNTDNEQSTGSDEPGFIFSRSSGTPSVPRLTTNESGSQDFFTARLKTVPANNGKVTLRLTTSDPTEVLLVDPADPTGNTKVQSLDIVFNAVTPTSGSKRETRWDSPITIQVVGVDDNNIDGTQDVSILTSTVDSSTTDPAYKTIDPPDPIVSNQDNENNGVTVTPRTLVIDEGSTDTFSVKLNARPTSNVVINVSSSDINIATAVVNGGASSSRITFTPDNYATPQTVTVRGVADSSFTQQRNATIVLSNAISSDTNFDNLDVPDVTVAVQNKTQAYIITPTATTTTGVTTSEDGQTATFSVRLSSLPTSNVVLSLTTNSSEATLSAKGQRTDPVVLTFTPQNYSTAQTVTVLGVDDDVADGNQPYTITGSVQTADTTYSVQPFPAIPGINLDNDGGTTDGGITFAANGTYNVSFPYATDATATGGLTQAQAFSLVSGTGTPKFTLYKFVVANQRNSRALNGGNDFVVVPPTEKLMRGIGYRLVTGANDIKLNTPTDTTTLKPYSGSTFSLSLNWNKSFIEDTSSTDNRNNGYNFIGFPFDPAKFNSVSFSNAQVKYGNDTYETVADAAAAGVIDQQLYSVDAQGNLTAVNSGDLQLRPYRAYFVRILRNDFPVILTLRNPGQ